MAGAPELVSQWRALVASHAAVSAALEHDLGERHGLGVTDFEAVPFAQVVFQCRAHRRVAGHERAPLADQLRCPCHARSLAPRRQ